MIAFLQQMSKTPGNDHFGKERILLTFILSPKLWEMYIKWIKNGSIKRIEEEEKEKEIKEQEEKKIKEE